MRSFLLSLAALLGLGSFTAFAIELAANVPARDAGSWLMEQTETISDGEATFVIRKNWKICLDARADRALHELEVREQQASVTSLKERCEEPKPMVSNNTLSWAMVCSGRSAPEDKIGKTEIRHTTIFVSGEETRAETVVINGGDPVRSRGRFATHMKRAGLCDHGSKPGDMVLMHWRVNGEETLKARQPRNLYDEIASRKTFTASRLAR